MKALLSRVPEITITFWIIKILSTTVGETGADFLSENLGLGLALTTVIMGIALIIAMIIQFKLKRYVPVSYWTVVIGMSIVGTLFTDLLVDDMGVPLSVTAIVFTIMMIVGFIVWYIQEKTLSIHSINTFKREAYYWIIIFLAFALGTGVGDLISEKLELGYGVALGIFAAAIAITAIAYFFFKLNATCAFWIAFILTRPLGASLGDLMTQAPKDSGLGFGITSVNIIFFTVITGSIIYLSIDEYSKLKKELYDKEFIKVMVEDDD